MTERRYVTKRQVQNGSEVIFELAGLGAFDRPVAGIMHPRRELVGEQFVADNKEFDGQHTDVVEMGQHPPEVAGCPRGQAIGLGRGSLDVEYSVAVLILDQWIYQHVSTDVTHANRGNLAIELNALLCNQVTAAECCQRI